MSTNKICDWFGHRDESLGDDRSCDFPSERFVCTRCGHTHSENEWARPPQKPKIRKAGFLFLVLGALVALYLLTHN